MSNRFERLPVRIFESSKAASKAIAAEIAALIKIKAAENKMCVLGLATGSSPKGVYEELVRLHREGELSFKNVISFNLDEYFPIERDARQSYYKFMHDHLFDSVDILPENVHIPDGTIDRDRVHDYCRDYEEKINACGGIDLQLLGIGRTGHIGFNEPGASIDSHTRLITLDHMTIIDAASDFFSEDNVPRKAITMGVGTIMQAKRIVLMAWGEGKAKIIKKAIEGPVTDSIPATFLQHHLQAEFILDEASSSELTRVKTPWLVGEITWNDLLIRKAVIWLALKLEKPILKLTNRDYADNGMSDLVTKFESAYKVNIKVFGHLQHTITGWPGGKPNADDTNRPERANPHKKRVIIFSPHPDDDVISMGGTFLRLVDQGHEVHVAYQTSGNIAVFDDDVIRFADFVQDYHDTFGLSNDQTVSLLQQVSDQIKAKGAGELDSEVVRTIKGLIRRGEAKAGCRFVGIPDSHAHFLNLPFYETGLVKKKPLGEEDVQITIDLLEKIQPHQIFAAGDLSDPHGTHRVCLNAIFEALARVKNRSWAKDCWLWLYRGAWQEWEIENIDMAVPISPEELLRKRRAIFKHQSQKDRPVFPGSDSREFWQRAEDRNRGTARTYDKLGLAEYEAMEAFKRYYF